jgi:hypothetical protein
MPEETLHLSRYRVRIVAHLSLSGFQIIAGVFFIAAAWGFIQGLAIALLGLWGIIATIAEMRELSPRQIQLWYLFKGIAFFIVGLLLLLGISVYSNSILTAAGLLGVLYGGWCTFSSFSQLRAMGSDR